MGLWCIKMAASDFLPLSVLLCLELRCRPSAAPSTPEADIPGKSLGFGDVFVFVSLPCQYDSRPKRLLRYSAIHIGHRIRCSLREGRHQTRCFTPHKML